MLDVCFHFDAGQRDFWDTLIRGYAVRHAYEIAAPGGAEMGWWNRTEAPGDIDTTDLTVVAFQPKNGKHFAGTVELREFQHPENALYVFGSDNCHNEPIECDLCVYIDMPKNHPLWASQAAGIVLYDRWSRHG